MDRFSTEIAPLASDEIDFGVDETVDAIRQVATADLRASHNSSANSSATYTPQPCCSGL